MSPQPDDLEFLIETSQGPYKFLATAELKNDGTYEIRGANLRPIDYDFFAEDTQYTLGTTEMRRVYEEIENQIIEIATSRGATRIKGSYLREMSERVVLYEKNLTENDDEQP